LAQRAPQPALASSLPQHGGAVTLDLRPPGNRSPGGVKVPPRMVAPASVLGMATGSLSGPNTAGEKLAAVLGVLSLITLLNLSWRTRITPGIPASCSYAPAVGPD
jgi:hypothetical protein